MEQKNINKMNIIKGIMIFFIIALIISIIGITIKHLEENKKVNSSNTTENNIDKNNEQNSNEIENIDATTNDEIENEDASIDETDSNVISNTATNNDNTNTSNYPTENKTTPSKTQTVTNNTINNSTSIYTGSNNENSTTTSNTSTTTMPTTSTIPTTSTTSTIPTTSTTSTANQPYYVKSEDEEILTNTETKYGVIIKTYTTITYSIFSDESKKEAGRRTRTEYDMSKYVEDNNQLLLDAKTMKSSNAGLINEVVSYTNQYRKEANEQNIDGITDRQELTLDNNLTIAACARAVEMAYSNTYSHTRPNGKGCATIITDLNLNSGGTFGGENIYRGPATAKSAAEGWKSSEGHYKNMINKYYSKIGVGVTRVNGNTYWVQIFAY